MIPNKICRRTDPKPLTHETSSAGARPSSAAPVEENQLVQRNSHDTRIDGQHI